MTSRNANPIHRLFRTVRVPVALGIAVVAVVAATAVQASPNDDEDITAVKDATAAFRDVDVIDDAGYDAFLDKDGVACIDLAGVGAMGVHHVNGALVGDAQIDPLAPEALVYQPNAQGRPRLVAVEYIVFEDTWDAAHDGVPTLFGEDFMLTPSPNRFGLPSFYALHAWVWKHNPDGTFAMWNPAVHCTD